MTPPAPRVCPLCGADWPATGLDWKPPRSATTYAGECQHCYYTGRRSQQQAKAYAEERQSERRAAVFGHYGWTCACCGTSESLTIDHVNGDGREHRQEVDSAKFYQWLIDNGFPEGFQALCRQCNASKGRGTRCRLHSTHIGNLANL